MMSASDASFLFHFILDAVAPGSTTPDAQAGDKKRRQGDGGRLHRSALSVEQSENDDITPLPCLFLPLSASGGLQKFK